MLFSQNPQKPLSVFFKKQSQTTEGPLKKLDINVPFYRKDSKASYPIPKGDSAYSKEKRAEYIDKNLKNAEKYYKLAIKEGDRPESAIKDLAGVMHQQGKTLEAIEFLKDHRTLFTQEICKYDNLLNNLRRQIVQRGNRLNKNLKISNLPLTANFFFVKNLFLKPERIVSIELYLEASNHYAIVRFSSHSAARKTLESFSSFDSYKVEWFSVSGDVAGDVLSAKSEVKKEKPAFVFRVFSRDVLNKSMVMPLAGNAHSRAYEISDEEAANLLDSSLIKNIFS